MGDGDTPLHLYLSRRSEVKLEIINCLVTNGASITTPNNDGNTPLHLYLSLFRFSYFGYKFGYDLMEDNKFELEILNRLVHPDALTTSNKDGNTPLHLYLSILNPEFIIYLMRGGTFELEILNSLVHPDALTTNKDGDTPLHLYLRSSEVQLEIVNCLITNGASTTFPNNDGDTPLHLYLRSSEVQLEIVNCLITNGASTTFPNNVGNTPLHLYLRWSSEVKLEIVNCLITIGASTTSPNKDGNTPLHLYLSLFTTKLELEILNSLVHPDALTTSNKDKDTPLHLYLRRSSEVKLEIVNCLVTNGASTTSQNNDKDTPLHLYLRRSSEVKLEIVNCLITSASITSPNKDGNTPLHLYLSLFTTKFGYDLMEGDRLELEILNSLVHPDALTKSNKNGNTPLHLYLRWRSEVKLEIVNYLITNGASTTSQNNDGDTPLHKYLRKRSGVKFEIVNCLLTNGASTTSLNNDGNTPLHLYLSLFTTKFGYDRMRIGKLELEILNRLVHPDALTTSNKMGKTPVSILKDNDQIDLEVKHTILKIFDIAKKSSVGQAAAAKGTTGKEFEKEPTSATTTTALLSTSKKMLTLAQKSELDPAAAVGTTGKESQKEPTSMSATTTTAGLSTSKKMLTFNVTVHLKSIKGPPHPQYVVDMFEDIFGGKNVIHAKDLPKQSDKVRELVQLIRDIGFTINALERNCMKLHLDTLHPRAVFLLKCLYTSGRLLRFLSQILVSEEHRSKFVAQWNLLIDQLQFEEVFKGVKLKEKLALPTPILPATPGPISPATPGSISSATPGPISPATPGPISPATPGPISPATPGPISPATPGPISPATPGPILPATPGPISPATPGPISPATPGPILPATPGPISPTPLIKHSTKQLFELIVDVNSFWKEYGYVSLLKLLLCEFQNKTSLIAIQNGKDAHGLFKLLVGPGILNNSDVTVLIEAVYLSCLVGLESKIMDMVPSFKGFENVEVRKFSKRRQNLVNFGFIISIDTMKWIEQLYNVKSEDQWDLIFKIEILGKLPFLAEKLKQENMMEEYEIITSSDN
ncbi:uncharacterized protein [Antedon mediterranea]|uniref:uncharacterized protein n=1 Tax=Antedon mediterranea TaxID=105859 RepID=UPI003AF91428